VGKGRKKNKEGKGGKGERKDGGEKGMHRETMGIVPRHNAHRAQSREKGGKEKGKEKRRGGRNGRKAQIRSDNWNRSLMFAIS